MHIHVDQVNRQFHLTNGQVSYIFHVMKNGQLGHLYYGKALRHRDDFSHLQVYDVPTGASCHVYADDPAFVLETLRQEYPAYGNSDFREPAISVRKENDSHVPTFVYDSYSVLEGKPRLLGLPATYGNEASTLLILLKDEFLQAELRLNYTIFPDKPVITRSASLTNDGPEKLVIERLMGAALELPDKDFIFTHLAGAWARERHVKERKLESGIQSISSLRGASSHHHNPFLALRRPDTTEHSGEVYGFNFVYSSNFLMQVEVDHYDMARVMVGIHPFGFNWGLQPKETFQTPEVVMVYSDKGLNGMSQALHQLYRENLIPEQWKREDRPILINNWEATYFDFNEEKLVKIAKSASELGIEMLVLDDGWFGKRNDDTSSLGDWHVDFNKLPNGLESLAKKINDVGIKFGLWFEPEMISPNSELFKEHPDWAVGMPDQYRTLGRNQLVLDFSRPEIVDYFYEKMSGIIKQTNLSYIKWDMNRNITEPFSQKLAANQQGEFFHRYILGVYSLYERLTSEFPHVLFESCAGGGGRFDPGMLYYAPQTWTSDNTDAVERLKIQYGTSFAYPLYSMGSHVSDVPNHQTFRETPLSTRANTAYFGTFGYELDPHSLTEEEREEIKEQVAFYKEQRRLIRDGHFYRLLSPFSGNETAWMVVSPDQSEALVGYYKVLATANSRKQQTLRLCGLSEDRLYEVDGRTYYGDELMQVGLLLPTEFNGVNLGSSKRRGDFQSYIFYLKCTDEQVD
ncbi:alpha-galactosidase [Bacillus sp. EB106-08-02-XG196]|uniref:alpha-galactosidase n=1 Tax=Bacillus sp. EB106-08-02-XG196 TaxID=2737049 RepID=UPI0015C4BFEC|nr:alpha-galactosidase [Bacillus sp. EB106-08-02-XG196]NWQ42443.1 alpha-galactosidase [Bacillus sp. EB106-08-02-XG196]